MIVIGLDLSLTDSGIASSTGECCSVGLDGVTKLPLVDRLETVERLAATIVQTAFNLAPVPALAMIEDPAFSRTGGGSLERHALWWKVAERLFAAGVPIAHVKPNVRIKYAIGKGTGKKGAVVDAVARRYPQFVTGGNDNQCDAAVLAAMGADHLGRPLATVPKSHRDALKSVVWPALQELR